MGYTCGVTECFTGYRSNKDKRKYAVFSFPTDRKLRRKWIRAIPRMDYSVTNSSKVCEKHFHQIDMQLVSSDKKDYRRKALKTQELQRKRLKPNAIPSIFPDLPAYLSKPSPTVRPTSTGTASSRLEKQNKKINEQNCKLLLLDAVKNFDSFLLKLADTCLPSGYVKVVKDRQVLFHYIQNFEDVSVAPKLLISVVVMSDLKIKVYIASALVSAKLYQHLMTSTSSVLQGMSELANILAFCKSTINFDDSEQDIHMRYVKLAISSLQHYLAGKKQSESLPHSSLIQFICEQLQLLEVSKNGRRYSVSMLTQSFFWQLTSTSLYKKLCSFFVLPSLSTLCKLSANNAVQGGKIDLQYLEQRTSHLNEKERVVTLMIDEVYTAQRIEYSNGAFVGLTEDGVPAKTVLSFMVQSAHGKYKDIVCLIPINRLDTGILRKWFENVMRSLDDLLFVAAVSVDNHVCNRKMFVDLCGGKLQHSIVHPTRPGERLFLVFDFTHNFKNIFNNFINKDRMHVPTEGYEDILGNTCTGYFTHIKQLYAIEEHKTLKVAFSLKKSSLNPSSIARTSPQHALSVFSESTVRGLQLYASSRPLFLETSKFVEFIHNIWKIMSVKSPFKAHHKKDGMYAPIDTILKDHDGMLYLKRAEEIFKTWRKSGNAGLTTETFTACIQTMGALPKLADYLQKRHGFSYVLSGKFMSDPIEARFGWYRQCNGGNFFMSVKQLLQSEKKIRCLSLLQQQALITASDLAVNDHSSSRTPIVASADVSWLEEFFCGVSLDDISEVDANVTYFVSGYIGRSVSRRRKCSACKELLVQDIDVGGIREYVPSNCTQLFELADRGGLSAPTELCFAVTALAVQHYTAVIADENVKRKLFALTNQRAVFTSALMEAKASDSFGRALKQTCSFGHCNFEMIIHSAFNCFAKNELKRMNSSKDAPPTLAQNRKIRKLRGKGSNKT